MAGKHGLPPYFSQKFFARINQTELLALSIRRSTCVTNIGSRALSGSPFPEVVEHKAPLHLGSPWPLHMTDTAYYVTNLPRGLLTST